MDQSEYLKRLQAGVPDILSYLQQVAERFQLRFTHEDYHFMTLSAEEKVLLDYLAGCPGLPHSNWGQDLPERRTRLPDFLASDAFRDYCAQLQSGGSVIGGEVLAELTAGCKAHPLPDWAQALTHKLSQHPALRQSFFVAICLREPSEALLQRQLKLLVHEWSHLLFFSNGIQFQKTAVEHPDAWLFDEGLANWVEYAWVAGTWACHEQQQEILALLQERGEPRSVTGYFEKGLWFNTHFNPLPSTAWAEELKTLHECLPASA